MVGINKQKGLFSLKALADICIYAGILLFLGVPIVIVMYGTKEEINGMTDSYDPVSALSYVLLIGVGFFGRYVADNIDSRQQPQNTDQQESE